MKKELLRLAIDDLIDGVYQWRVWVMLAIYELRGRYRRSTIGQFWITISMAVTIGFLSVVYSLIFKLRLADYLPVLSISFICWSLIASLVNEGATVFIESEAYLRSTALPRSSFVYKYLLRNLIVFAHNLVLVPVVLLIAGIIPSVAVILFIPAVLLTLANGLWLGIVVGTIGARFRDAPLIVASLVQIAFFVSPVIWGRAQLGSANGLLIALNPFAIMLELMRQPLLGQFPPLSIWLSAFGILLAGFAFALPFYCRFRGRISFYV